MSFFMCVTSFFGNLPFKRNAHGFEIDLGIYANIPGSQVLFHTRKIFLRLLSLHGCFCSMNKRIKVKLNRYTVYQS